MILPNISPEDAIALLKTKTDPASRHNLAVAYRTVNDLDASQEIAVKLWEEGYRDPALALLISNLFLDCGNYERYEEWTMNAWTLQAPHEMPQYALPLATARMRLQKWDRMTWHLWEVGREGRSWNPVPGTTRWRGEQDGGVVALSEGGYGDAFLFSRFLPMLPKEFHSLMVWGPQFAGLKGFRSDWGQESLWFDEQIGTLDYKYSTALMSFMSTMDVKSPAEIPTSYPPVELMGRPRMASRMTGLGKPRIGLCWQAEENGVQKRIRSIDNAEEIAILQPHGPFVNLCPGRKIEGRHAPALIDMDIQSWTDTARIIAGLDCVVSVDTAVLHLAGMLGVPAIGILPLASDWKWGVESESNWWWRSVRLVRNTSPYSFRPALEQVAAMLEKL